MSGRHIDDHSSFAGKAGKEYPLPTGNKMKSFKSSEGSGHVGTNYPDTTEAIHKDQQMGDREMKKQKMKAGYRY
jgi:hypothetical protein